MTNGISFFTPLKFHTNESLQYWTALFDDFFYLGGRKAEVIPNEQSAVMMENACSKTEFAWKVTAYVLGSLFLLLPLWMLIAKGILRSQWNIEIIDPRLTLTQGINIDPEAATNVLSPNWTAIQNGTDSPALLWHNKAGPDGIRSFSLQSNPNCTFYMLPTATESEAIHNRQILEKHFNRTAEVEGVKILMPPARFDRLIIPRAKIGFITIDGLKIPFLAQHRLCTESKAEQKQRYREAFDQYTPRELAQLCDLIKAINLSFVNLNTIPLINDADGAKIVLTDVTQTQPHVFQIDGVANGFLGSTETPPSKGLFGCMQTQDQVYSLRNTLLKSGLTHQNLQKLDLILEKRLERIKEKEHLQRTYNEKNLTQFPHLPISTVPGKLAPFLVDINLDTTINLRRDVPANSPGSSTDPRTPVTTVRTAITNLINCINQAIAETPSHLPAKKQRCIEIDLNSGLLKDYPPDVVNRILYALKIDCHIFSYTYDEQNMRFKIQA